MKKIFLATGVFAPDIGGPASYTRAIGEKLARGYEVTVLTYSSVWNYPRDASFPFRVVRVWSKWPWFIRHTLYLITVLMHARQSDLAFALNAVNAGPAMALAAKLFGKKYLIKIVGDRAWEGAIQSGKTNLLINDFQHETKKGWTKLVHHLQYWSCVRAHAVIVPSEYLAGIVHGWGISRDKIHTIYNGADFQPSELQHDEARRQLGISGNIILSIGRLVPWKGFRMLIKIMPQLLQVNQFFRLVIVGDGPDMPMLQSMLKNLGLDRKVYLVGRKSPSELATYLAAADMFVLNSGYEGFSHQILEVMMASVPVITTAVGGNREVLRQGENGFLVKYNDEFNLVEAIKTLWNMVDLREKFILEGRITAAQYSATRMERETLELISRCI